MNSLAVTALAFASSAKLDLSSLIKSPIALLIGSVVIVSLLGWMAPSFKAAFVLNPHSVRNRGQIYRLLSAGWLHADSSHLFFNMLTLYFFAEQVESVIGTTQFLALYASAIVVAFVPTTLRHMNQPRYNSLGASGAVTAVMLSATLLHPGLELYLFFLPIRVPALLYMVLYMAYSVWHSWGSKGGDGINHDAHFSGAFYGALFTYAFEPQRVTATLRAWF